MVVHPTIHAELERLRREEAARRAARAGAAGPARSTGIRLRTALADRVRPLAFRIARIPAPAPRAGTC